MHAGVGIWTALKTQINLRLHLFFALLASLAGLYFAISIIEWLFLILTITVVLIAELVNTSLEFTSDAISRKQNPLIKQAKDVAAGSVLVSAIFALVVGLIIFLPRVINLIVI
ncbi:MAG: Diacylglycerol kinase [Microgenomates group bacterium GW2011_GWF2_47_9]|nr:MAG: Diacylglycerol kinase [Microgenomates group bacterium GW2011_GWF2_47_9]